MTDKTKKKIKLKITKSTLIIFAEEIKKAGNFDELMIKKQAVEPRNGAYAILTYENISEYKRKYLTKHYQSLRPYFNTKVPYSFWCQLYMALRREEILSK
jgi:hypothetical protein